VQRLLETHRPFDADGAWARSASAQVSGRRKSSPAFESRCPEAVQRAIQGPAGKKRAPRRSPPTKEIVLREWLREIGNFPQLRMPRRARASRARSIPRRFGGAEVLPSRLAPGPTAPEWRIVEPFRPPVSPSRSRGLAQARLSAGFPRKVLRPSDRHGRGWHRLGPDWRRFAPCRTAGTISSGSEQSVRAAGNSASGSCSMQQETICLWPASRSLTSPRTMAEFLGEKGWNVLSQSIRAPFRRRSE